MAKTNKSARFKAKLKAKKTKERMRRTGKLRKKKAGARLTR